MITRYMCEKHELYYDHHDTDKYILNDCERLSRIEIVDIDQFVELVQMQKDPCMLLLHDRTISRPVRCVTIKYDQKGEKELIYINLETLE